MCGIAGIINFGGVFSREQLQNYARAMANTMLHRGPDDGGVWVDPSGRVAFSQRRLSIIDLSPAGHQPMLSADQKACITFNGEIYNFHDLRKELEARGVQFRTKTDTEVLMESLRVFGQAALAKLDGMFAFALFEQNKRDIILARDPFGEKPLYYTRGKGFLAFASELQALSCLPDFDAALDQEAIAEYLMFHYAHAPRTIYRDARKLPPGHLLRLSPEGNIHIDQYFRFAPGEQEFDPRSIPELAEELEPMLVTSLRRRLESDVPLGAFLSGGVDSSLVVSLLRNKLNRDVLSFSIGFEGAGQESEHLEARSMAQHLGTRHHEKILTPDVFELLKLIGSRLDEPNSDSSCLPVYLLSQFTREHVTVALSGDGGDELFGGYGRYFATIEEEARYRRGELGSWRPSEAYLSDRILIFPPAHLQRLLGSIPPQTAQHLEMLRLRLNNEKVPLLSKLRSFDTDYYMPGAVLPKVDRMSMQFALEVRTPFLSVEIARFCERLSQGQCYANGQGKLVLKEIASRYIPREWLFRQKRGFGLPTLSWGKDGLLKALEEVMTDKSCTLLSLIGADRCRQFLDDQRRAMSTYRVWAILILEQWLQSHRHNRIQEHEYSAARIPRISGTGQPVPPPALPGSLDCYPALDQAPRNSVLLITESEETAAKFTRFPAIGVTWGLRTDIQTPEEMQRCNFHSMASAPVDELRASIGTCTHVLLTVSEESLPAKASQVLRASKLQEVWVETKNSWAKAPLARPLPDEHPLQVARNLGERARLALARRIIKRLSTPACGVTFSPNGGAAYRWSLPHLVDFGDTVGITRSPLLLFENETLLTATSSHEKIRQEGKGCFSHWEGDVYFSSTDNSNPNSNARQYSFILRPKLLELCKKWGLSPEQIFHHPGSECRLFESKRLQPLGRRQQDGLALFAEISRAPAKPSSETLALLIGTLGPGGAERQLVYTASGLQDHGHKVCVFTFGAGSREDLHYLPTLEDAGVTVESADFWADSFQLENEDYLPLSVAYALPVQCRERVWALYTHLKVTKPRVLHCFLDEPNLVGAIAGVLAGVPHIFMSVRNSNPTNFWFCQDWFKPWYEATLRCPRVHLSSNSHVGAKSYAEWLKIPAASISVIHNGLDVRRIAPLTDADKKDLREALGILPNSPLLAGVFRLSQEKQPLMFLRVVSALVREIPNLCVVIAGIGPERAEMDRFVRENKLSNQVQFLGRRADAQRIIGAADLLLLASSFEGIPNVVLEAQALGRPVVCTDVGDCSHLVIDGETGFVRPSQDEAALVQACLALLKEPKRAEAMGQAGRRHIEQNFSIGRLIRETEAMYGLADLPTKKVVGA